MPITSDPIGAMKRKARREGWLKQIRSENDERAALEGCTFNKRAAWHVVEFFPRFLRHSKGRWAGQPFELQPWQRDDLFFPIFGWQRPDGTRRIRRVYCELGKKNGKSSLASGLGLYMLCGDSEAGAECFARRPHASRQPSRTAKRSPW